MNSASLVRFPEGNKRQERRAGGLSPPRQLQIEQTGAGSTVKYHGMYVAKDAVATDLLPCAPCACCLWEIEPGMLSSWIQFVSASQFRRVS